MCVNRTDNNMFKKATKNLVVTDFCINTHTHTHTFPLYRINQIFAFWHNIVLLISPVLRMFMDRRVLLCPVVSGKTLFGLQ